MSETPNDPAESGDNPKESQLTSSVTLVDEDLSGVVGDLETPEVQAHAVEAARERKASETPAPEAKASSGTDGASPVKGKTDSKGRPFDPAIHERGADGGPLINSEGYIKCRRGGAAQKHQRMTSGKFVPPSAGAKPTAPDTSAVEAQVQATGATAAVLVVSLAQMVGGEDFKPESGEAEGMAAAFASYFRSKGISDIPPGAALAITLAAYVGKRWNRPKFAEKRTGILFAIRRWINDFRFRRSQSAKED